MVESVAITGAGGFVGSRLVVALATQGWRVYAVTSQPERVSRGPMIKVLRCDWSREGIEAAFAQAKDAKIWVHTAARVDLAAQDILGLYRDNGLLTNYLVQLVAQLGTDTQFIYLSSISVYGKGQQLSTGVEPRPDTHYGLSKFLGEQSCMAHLGHRCLVLRLAGVWGREKSPKLFINQCLREAQQGCALKVKGFGNARRNYLWIGDVSKLILFANEERWQGVRLAAGPEAIPIRAMITSMAIRFRVPVQFAEDPAESESDVIVDSSSGFAATPFEEALTIEKDLS